MVYLDKLLFEFNQNIGFKNLVVVTGSAMHLHVPPSNKTPTPYRKTYASVRELSALGFKEGGGVVGVRSQSNPASYWTTD